MSRPSPVVVVGFVRRFLAAEAAAGAACVAAIVVAMVWVNSPWHTSYDTLWRSHIASAVGPVHLPGDLRSWIADGAMAVFFFVVGLEVKREIVAGELRHWKAAALPILCAIGGMVVPALIYAAATAGRDVGRGWAIPMATDLAVAVGVLAVLGTRVPVALKVFLLTLAVADDIGAVVVITVLFTADVHLGALLIAAVGLAVIAVVARRAARAWPLIAVLAVVVWLATLRAGVHPTVAGVAVAFALPTGSATMILEERLHRVVGLVVVPIFVVTAAGVRLVDTSLSGDSGRVAAAVAVSLVVGKAVGVGGAAVLLVRLGLGRLPAGTSWRQMAGVSVLCGVGLTVAVLVADLSLHGAEQRSAAKLGVLGASIVAGAVGAALLGLAGRRPVPARSSITTR